MQQLHLVGMTTDLEGLIFSVRKGSKSGSFIVPLDDQVLATITETLRRREGGAAGSGMAESAPPSSIQALTEAAALGRVVRPESHLSPREIQARLRAGRSVEDVAQEAGVDAEWVDRFATPVRAEQARVVERALKLNCVRPRHGESAQPLESSVRWNLFDKGVRLRREELEEGWDAYQVHDTVWVVRFQYRARGRDQVAEWEVDLGEGRVGAVNRLASQLGYVERGRRRRPPALGPASPPAAPAPAAAQAPATKSAAAKASRPSRGRAPASSARATPVGRKATAKPASSEPAKKKRAAPPRPTPKPSPKAATKKSAAGRRGGAAAARATKAAPGRAAPGKAAPGKAAPATGSVTKARAGTTSKASTSTRSTARRTRATTGSEASPSEGASSGRRRSQPRAGRGRTRETAVVPGVGAITALTTTTPANGDTPPPPAPADSSG